MSISKTSAFNLKAVLQETGIAADTLRAWERRYGLPMPQRTAGGHRLYSQADIETVKWLSARQAEGLSISRAVEMWNRLLASGTDPLAAQTSKVDSPLDPPDAETSLNRLLSQWITDCMNFNEQSAEQTLNQAFAMYPVETVCTKLIQSGLAAIGVSWYEHLASVQQEHFASSLAMRRLNSLLSATPAPTREQTVLVACPPNEWHTFPPLMLTLLLRRRGWNVVYLGANVPVEQLSKTVDVVNASLVVLAAQQLVTAVTLRVTADALTERGISVAFGGRIFNLHRALPAHIAGDFLGASVDSAISEIESLLNAPAKSATSATVTERYTLSANMFKLQAPQIEAVVNKSLSGHSPIVDGMKTATKFLSDNIVAALELGDMNLLENEIEWVRSLLAANRVPPEALEQFLKVYKDAVSAHMKDHGHPILNWLERKTVHES